MIDTLILLPTNKIKLATSVPVTRNLYTQPGIYSKAHFFQRVRPPDPLHRASGGRLPEPQAFRFFRSVVRDVPFLLKLYADSGYQGPKFQQGLRRVCGQVNIEIVKRSDASTFVVLPKRWTVERTIAWLNRCRRLAKDWECLSRNALAFLRWASVRLMLRKLCRATA